MNQKLLQYHTPIEPKRLCGYRTVGSLYLIANPNFTTCHRLPLPLNSPCSTCGEMPRFNRSISYISPLKLFQPCSFCLNQPVSITVCSDECPACNPPLVGFLSWVGAFYYSPLSFLREANTLGISKKIPFVPKHFNPNTPWYFAHPNVMLHPNPNASPKATRQGVFLCGYFQRFEKLIWEKDATEDTVLDLQKKGINAVIVPNDNPHHAPRKQKELT